MFFKQFIGPINSVKLKTIDLIETLGLYIICRREEYYSLIMNKHGAVLNDEIEIISLSQFVSELFSN